MLMHLLFDLVIRMSLLFDCGSYFPDRCQNGECVQHNIIRACPACFLGIIFFSNFLWLTHHDYYYK